LKGTPNFIFSLFYVSMATKMNKRNGRCDGDQPAPKLLVYHSRCPSGSSLAKPVFSDSG